MKYKGSSSPDMPKITDHLPQHIKVNDIYILLNVVSW